MLLIVKEMYKLQSLNPSLGFTWEDPGRQMVGFSSFKDSVLDTWITTLRVHVPE